LSYSVPAKIQSKIANVTVNEQDSIDLKCEVSGHPAPSVTWTKDGAPVQSVVAGVIHIGKSKRDDSGAYVCKADNNVGQADQMRVFVTVNCKYKGAKQEGTVIDSQYRQPIKCSN